MKKNIIIKSYLFKTSRKIVIIWEFHNQLFHFHCPSILEEKKYIIINFDMYFLSSYLHPLYLKENLNYKISKVTH